MISTRHHVNPTKGENEMPGIRNIDEFGLIFPGG
jgi:hypothetical protein